MLYLITCDIAGDRRREDVAALLSGYGPRVQLSVFECDLRTRRDAAGLRARLRDLIHPLEDQVRVYPLDDRSARGVVVLGARVIEEARTSGSSHDPVQHLQNRF
jgi:CRISPR-associated protein Cas2